MAPIDPAARQAELIAAARAATRWARARRATWADAPLAELALEPPPPVRVSPPRRRKTGPSMFTRIAAQVRTLRDPVVEWGPRVAGALAVSAVAIAGGRYVWQKAPSWKARVAELEPARRPAPPAAPKTTGDLSISTTPSSAQVILDGKARGITPLTLTDLASGRHTLVLRSESGTIERTVTIAAGKTATVDESIFSGWVAVFAPFDVTVSERGRTLRMDEHSQVMLSPGRHDLRLMNRTLGYDEVRQVDVKPGESTRVSITPPPTSVTLTAPEPAEVWVDGTRIGVTPLSAAIGLGTHEFVVRRANGAEKRFTATVTVKPMTLNVDF